MATLKIKISRNTKLIDYLFDDIIENSGKVSKITCRIYKAMYKKKIDTLFFMLKKRLKRWIITETKNYFLTEDTGDKEYIESKFNEWNKFINADEKTLKKHKEYNSYKSDKIMFRIRNILLKNKEKFKSKFVNVKLGGKTVLDFFTGLGITFECKVKY